MHHRGHRGHREFHPCIFSVSSVTAAVRFAIGRPRNLCQVRGRRLDQVFSVLSVSSVVKFQGSLRPPWAGFDSPAQTALSGQRTLVGAGILCALCVLCGEISRFAAAAVTNLQSIASIQRPHHVRQIRQPVPSRDRARLAHRTPQQQSLRAPLQRLAESLMQREAGAAAVPAPGGQPPRTNRRASAGQRASSRPYSMIMQVLTK